MNIDLIKLEALENDVPIIQDASLNKILELIKENNVKNVLEIGTAVAYSSICFKVMGKVDKVVTIERNIDMYNKALENIDMMSLNDSIHVIFGDALEIDLKGFSQEFDLLFIDAAKAQNQKFFERYLPFMKTNALIVVDNILFHGVNKDDPNISKNLKHLIEKIEKYVEWIKNNEEFETTFFLEGDGLTISRRKKV